MIVTDLARAAGDRLSPGAGRARHACRSGGSTSSASPTSILTIAFNSAGVRPRSPASSRRMTSSRRNGAHPRPATSAAAIVGPLLASPAPPPDHAPRPLLLIDALTYVLSAISLVLIARSFNRDGGAFRRPNPAPLARPAPRHRRGGCATSLGHPVLRRDLGDDGAGQHGHGDAGRPTGPLREGATGGQRRADRPLLLGGEHPAWSSSSSLTAGRLRRTLVLQAKWHWAR